ncbi:hypothetical protein L5M28_19000 [Shewanella sp. SW32]|uniref:hypothetical protein n=1 Tax=Shewanella TaxID=22 RepID=UPI0021D9E998|nr:MULTISPECIES: hypothetical protein [unclassified Shewanella]MCU7964641.1 hypothetical protein [Shewanella sp. SW32]MCU7972566.1 hypothetical protein [Shewanella sp. SW29]
MLRLLDCVTGDIFECNTSVPIDSGRFALLEKASLGALGVWPEGTLLFDDGRGQIVVSNILLRFNTVKTDSMLLAKRQLAFDALENIKLSFDKLDTDHLVSPVIPAEIAKSLEPTELQIALNRVLSLGHLQAIAKAPRITMRYDEELLPVSRVKRTANNYQRHLAAHSECWQQRTFIGIVPSKLRAKISEDEVHIYENRVFARLLDHLERFLRTLIAQVKQLNEAMRQGLDLEGSSSLHRSLRHSVCETWGESFKDNEAEQLKQYSEHQLISLEEQLRKILQLKQTETYRCIPRDAAVSLVLKNTNILHNDPHYIQVRQLWELWVKEIEFVSRNYQQIFKKAQFHVECYRDFIGLLLLRSHKKLGWTISNRSKKNWVLTHPCGIEGQLYFRDGNWHLLCKNAGFDKKVLFVPLINASQDIEAVCGRILCCLNWKGDAEGIINCSPEDLFSEELMIVIIQRWWSNIFASEYGEVVSNLPQTILEQWPKLHASGVFYAQTNEGFNIYAWIDNFQLAPTNKDAVLRRYFAAEALKFCPCCGVKTIGSNLVPRSGKGFKASCELCSATWQIRSNGSLWVFEIGSNIKVEKAGRWQQTINLFF